MGVKSGGRRGIQSRLIRVFAVQATIVSLATGLGVYAAYKVAEDVLVKQALTGEAEHYWKLVAQHGTFPLPNTNNMQGYLATIEAVKEAAKEDKTGQVGKTEQLGKVAGLPAPLRSLTPGFGPVDFGDRQPLVYVSERDGERLYLLFKEEQVSKLALFFGVAPLTLVLILIYVASWYTFKQSQRVISPVVQLAKAVEKADVRSSDSLALEMAPFYKVDADIGALAIALERFAKRLEAFVDRERSFTRDASHELRTPLAVIKGCVDILVQQEDFSASGGAVLQRIRSTTKDMEGLIETLLMLAREEISLANDYGARVNPAKDGEASDQYLVEAAGFETVLVNELMPKLVNQVQKALNDKAVEVHIEARHALTVAAPQKVLSILFTNLLRNAVHHGGGVVEIVIDDEQVTVKDSGQGMSSQQMEQVFQPFYRVHGDEHGHGLGLTIVKRLCDRFRWDLQAYSSPGIGTSMTIKFPAGIREG